MNVTYFDWGGTTEQNHDNIDVEVKRVHIACINNSSCEVIELRKDVERGSQSIIVDFADGSFNSENTVGIYRVERLALTYNKLGKSFWEVRALRIDFPITSYQNYVPEGEPRSLCLFLEPWESLERAWTPESFLNRIFWWLRTTVDGTIHDNNQPIEQIFFSSSTNIFLPENIFESTIDLQKRLSFTFINYNDGKAKTLIGEFSEEENKSNFSLCVPVSIFLDPIEIGPMEDVPYTLGELQEILEQRGSSVVDLLKVAIRNLVTENGIEFQQDEKEFLLLLLGIPRVKNGEIVNLEIRGFEINSEIGYVGECLSVIIKSPDDKKWYRSYKLGCETNENDENWKSLSINPINVHIYPSAETIRRISGLDANEVGPVGIIAGVGALGGLLAKIWGRECWGEWTYVDHDIVQPHNLARHISSRKHLGCPKTIVIQNIVNDIHNHYKGKKNRYFVASIDSRDPKLNSAIEEAEILIDATTTLHIPRIISRENKYPRTLSVFITPSGMASVMLLEDKDRLVRCASLEAQYYRAILNSDWGAGHLVEHMGQFWIGAGCREITVAMSDELVHLHAAILSRQIRKSATQQAARICIWDYQDDTGEINSREISVFPSRTARIANWEIIWDDGFIEDASRYRFEALPNEIGGILFGIVDHKDMTITLVKAAIAPENSKSTPSNFRRAAYNSPEVLEDCHKRTAGIVGYVGEWHSHPPGHSVSPSEDDMLQLEFLTSTLKIDGLPGIMMIIGDLSVGFYLDNQGKNFGIYSQKTLTLSTNETPNW